MIHVRIVDSALDDLREILAHYRVEDVPEIGQRFVAEIMARIEQLSDHPDIGRIVPEFDTSNLRELIHSPFRIVYWRETDRVTVIRVWRSERLLQLPK